MPLAGCLLTVYRRDVHMVCELADNGLNLRRRRGGLLIGIDCDWSYQLFELRLAERRRTQLLGFERGADGGRKRDKHEQRAQAMKASA